MVTSGLVGFWPLSEWSGRANDLSGNDNHGTVNGATQGVAGVGGLTSYSFDGSDDYVDVNSFADNSNLNDRCISAWVKFNSNSENNVIFQYYDSTDASQVFLRGNSKGNIDFGIEDENNNIVITEGPAYSTNVWYHIVGVINDSMSLLFVNGSFKSAENLSNLGNVSPDLANIGRTPSTGSNVINGSISDVRVYNRALSPSEVQYLYQMGTADVATPPGAGDSGAVSRWSFDDRSDTSTALDEWSSNDGTINGNVVYSADSIQGLSLDFGGTTSDFVDTNATISGLNMSDSFGISLWSNLDSASSGTPSFISNFDDSTGISVQIATTNNNALRVYLDGTLIDYSEVKVGAYNHIAVSGDGSTVHLYLNGTKVGESSWGSEDITSTSNILIGKRADNDDPIDGRIDDVRFYSDALSDYEVQQLYQFGTRGIDMRSEVMQQ